jgi:hypothetical protein
MIGFLAAMLLRNAYAGTLHDPNGIQPLRLSVRGKVREVDMNAVLVIAGAVVLIFAVVIF